MTLATPASGIESLVRRALLSRATFQPRAVDHDAVRTLGAEAWLERQLAPETIDDAALDARLAPYGWLGRTATELRSQYGGGGGWTLSEQSKAVRLLRAVFSERQLLERVVDLWNDHFNVPFSAQDANFLRPPHEEHVIRAHALGTFPELLRAVARSPAMGAYLDQDSNAVGAPNENWARELLELHTLGHGSGYTEVDVREVARCFTGWGYVRHWQSGPFGTFRFDAARHDAGEKVVLGHVIPAGGGVEDGDRVLDLLLADPRTPRFVAGKIVHWFLGAEAAAATDAVARVEATYLATGGSIRAMVRTCLEPRTLAAAQPWRRTRLKRPFHWAVSLLRAVGARVTVPTTGVYALEGLGQVPFEWPDPDGYPDDAGAWISGLTPRWHFASLLLNGWASWVRVDAAELLGLCAGAGPDLWPRAIDAALTSGAMSESDRDALTRFVTAAPGSSTQVLVGAFELAASSPSFQQY